MSRGLARRAALLGGAWLLVAGPAHARDEPLPAPEAPATLRAALVEVLEAELPPDRAGVRLAGSGPAVLPLVFDALVAGRWPRDPEAESADAPPLERSGEQALAACVRALGRAPVAAFLAERAAGDPSPRERVVALGWLGEVGRAAELTLAVDVALSGSGETADLDVSMQAALRGAVESVLSREPACLVELGDLLLDAKRSACRVPLLQAAGALPPPLAFGLFGELLERGGGDGELTRAVLSELGKAASRVRPIDDEPLLSRVRALLRPATPPQVLRESAVAAGRLGDHEAVPALVALLEHEERGVRDGAHWSLTRLTGLALPADPAAWRRWLNEEESWFERESPALFERLRSGGAGEVAGALNEIVRHRLHRLRLSREAARALSHPSADVRRLACSVVGQLGACPDPSALVTALGDPNPGVSREAWSALSALTGWTLPPDADAWAEALAAGSPEGIAVEPAPNVAGGAARRSATAFSRL